MVASPVILPDTLLPATAEILTSVTAASKILLVLIALSRMIGSSAVLLPAAKSPPKRIFPLLANVASEIVAELICAST